MRSSLLLIFSYSLLFSSHSFGMQALFHWFDKNWIDQINYVTEAKSADICDRVLAFNPDSQSPRPFMIDQATLDAVHQGFEREEKILYIVEEAINKQDSHIPIEQVLQSAHTGYYSQNALALMHGYLAAKIRISEETTAKLKRAREGELHLNPTNTTIVTSSDNVVKEPVVHVTAYDLSPSALEQLFLKSNPSWAMKLANLVRKKITNPIGYLTDHKAAVASEAVLLFYPDHPQKVDFNQSMPLHKELVHGAFERQIRLHTLIEEALKNNDHQTMLTLSQRTRRGYFSKFAQAVFGGYLKFAAERSKIDNQVRSANAENARRETAGQIPTNPSSGKNSTPPLGKNQISSDGKCSCQPPKLLKDCAVCFEKYKKAVQEKNNTALISPQAPPAPPSNPTTDSAGTNADTNITSSDVDQPLPPSEQSRKSSTDSGSDIHTKPLPPAPPRKNSPLNLSKNCMCNPPKKVADCQPCLSKLLQQPSQ